MEKKQGVAKQWTEAGQLAYVTLYQSDHIKKITSCYLSSGKKQSETYYKNDKKMVLRLIGMRMV